MKRPVSGPLTADELAFFDGRFAALPLYEALREGIVRVRPEALLEVKKTQISFFSRRMFAAVSFAPVRRAALRPPVFLTLTLGLARPLEHPRADRACEPYPGRWTNHLTLGSAAEVDGELLGWLREAADFAGR